jgi:hypothetical protein
MKTDWINKVSAQIAQRIYAKSVIDKRDIALIVRKTILENEFKNHNGNR